MKLIINNLAIEYQDAGKGPAILLLHGWQDDLRTFDALTTELPGYRVVRLDLPGFGQSETPEEAWTIDDYVGLVKNFLEKLQIKPRAIVGHSFGGRIAIKGLATGALMTERLVLIASAGIAKSNSTRNQLFKAAAKIGRVMTWTPPLVFWRHRLRRKLYGLAGSDYLDSGDLKETYLNTIREDLESAAAQIATPTLLIWGRDDHQTPVEDGRRLAQLIKGSRLRELQGSHFVHQEWPSQVAELIKEFLK